MSFDIKRVDQEVAPFVDGVLITSASGDTIEVMNPSNGKRALSIPAGCDKDVATAVASARRAYADGRWSEAPPSIRKKTLHRLADLIAANSGALDALDAGEMGKPIRERCANAASAAGLTRFYAEAVDKVCGDTYNSDKTTFVAQRRVPRGIVAAVTPWNFPTVNAMSKVAPALAAGNCVVLKPSELSSRSAMRLAILAVEAGLPPGVLNVVPGRGETVGRALGMHMDVNMLTFTGSTEIGKQMMCYAGQSNLKVVMTECGGKSPQIVFGDGVDLDAAAKSVAQAILTNQGQVCSAGTRLLVQRSIEPVLLEKILAQLENISIGNALDPHTTFGPLASSQQCARVMKYIQSAKDEGVELVAGGKRALPETGGYFVEPTLFRNVPPTARIAQEEIFGPVLSVIKFENEAEAIRIANATIYGLAAYVWTADLSRAMRVTKAIHSSIWVNAAAPSGEGAGHAASYEPAFQSGIGTEGGLAGMESYLRRQLVWINHS
ncbi:aldehyde dehydrogenase [Steroidobacter agaridevorans]|uniref:Aldehyde dehydrogenase n=1 Tax=Steroidobacter agaridevorans TaxID=2695856 RepID=A0A829Y9X5_9GAMM|nr:aldehyde dehydrogenase family protein [Steroidobacter agaridevorans]GFE79658.1 aldehyde dehydrogenase [Steroidobacter agaridevorans]GFE90800.1 aldehyde dehydrogenase [Steroidobacter agaridevorans]